MEAVEHLIVGDGWVTALFDRQHPALDFLRIGASERQVDGAAVLRHFTDNDCLIFFMQTTRGRIHLFGQSVLRVAIFGYDQKPGCIHIQAIDETNLVVFTFLEHLLHQTVGDGVAGLALGRVDDHARLFVDDQQVSVLIDHRDRNILRREIALFLRKLDRDDVTGCRCDPPLHGFSVEFDQMVLFQFGHQAGRKGETGVDEFLDGASGVLILLCDDVLKLRHRR